MQVIDWKKEADSISDAVIAMRRRFHRCPELGNAEFKTSELICEYINNLGILVERPFGTAVMGIIQGTAKDNTKSKTVALRADMDALPIEEKTGLLYSSENEGVMHACGHDMHISSLLGAATLLSKHRHDFCGTIKLLFQPDEEYRGGAMRFIEAGCLDDVSSVFGLHVSSDLPTGHIGIRYGSFYAASNPFIITVHGKSSHAAEPEKGINAIAAASAVVKALEPVPACFKEQKSVISVCTFNAGSAENILADKAELTGIIRTFGEDARSKLKEIFKSTVEEAVKSYGATVDISIRDSYPGVYNTDNETELAFKTAKETLGADNVSLIQNPTMTSEDFGYYILKCSGSFAHLGVGNTFPLHHPQFSPDENALAYGSAYLASVAFEALK